MEIATEIKKKKKVYTERNAQFQCSLKILAHINMFEQYCLGNKKPTFLASNPEQVYAAILKSSKNNDLFLNPKPTLVGSSKFPEIFLTWFL